VNEVIDALWSQIEPDVYITREQFARGLEEWEITPIRIGGELAYVTLIRGPELHYTSFGGHRISPGLIRGWLAPLLERYGYATTRTPREELRQQRLNVLIGGRVTEESEFFVHFRLDQKCRS
jgi:hypothetical protein